VFERHINGGGRGHVGGVAVGGEGTCIVNGEVWVAKYSKVFFCWSDQHVVHEKSVVGAGAYNTYLSGAYWVPASVAVKDVETFQSVEVDDSSFSVEDEGAFIHLIVGGTFTPPDFLLGIILLDNTFVLGGPASLGPAEGGQSASGGDVGAGFIFQSVFVEFRHREIVEDCHWLETDVSHFFKHFFYYVGGISNGSFTGTWGLWDVKVFWLALDDTRASLASGGLEGS